MISRFHDVLRIFSLTLLLGAVPAAAIAQTAEQRLQRGDAAMRST